MAENERILSHIIDYDSKNDIAIIKFDFLEPEKQKIIEDLYQSKKQFSLWIKKPFRKLKTYKQLKKYFALLKKILIDAEIEPNSETTKTLDIEMKKSILPCKQIDLNGNIILIVPSKAELDSDTMSFLIQEIMNRYGVE